MSDQATDEGAGKNRSGSTRSNSITFFLGTLNWFGEKLRTCCLWFKSKCKCLLLWLARLILVASVAYFVFFCLDLLFAWEVLPACSYCTYVALAGFLAALVCDFLVRHKSRVRKARIEDRSEIEALIREAQLVLDENAGENLSELHEKKQAFLEKEVQRLQQLGPSKWTEYRVLTLDSLLIDFLSCVELKARARSSLADLKEYADGTAFSYDVQHYYDWEKRIESNIAKIDEWEGKKESNKQRKALKRYIETLRANLQSLLEHVANYEANWSEGSSVLSGIQICGSAAVVVFLVMGILPVSEHVGLDQAPPVTLGILNWGFLGASGAVASVLIGLRNSNLVEVGTTKGKKELWRMVLGAPLGFLSGVLVLSIIQGGLIQPEINDLTKVNEWAEIYRSIALSVGAGMALETVFQRVRAATEI